MDWSNNEPIIPNQSVAKWTGALFIIAGIVLFYDAHQGRGQDPPFWSKFLPGL